MNTVTLKTNGALFCDGNPVGDEPLMCLGMQVALDAGFTLRSVFRMIEKYPLLARLNAFLSTYMEQYRNVPANGCTCEDFDHISFGKTVEMIGYPGEPRLEIYSSLKGEGRGTSYEIRNYELEHLLDMPLQLGKLRHIVFGDKVEEFAFSTVFTLFEFIDGITWELSFHVIPEQCEFRR